MGNVIKLREENWTAVAEYFDPKRQFAICAYVFFAGFIVAVAALINRYMLKHRLKKVEDLRTLFTHQGEGSTRLVLWMITVSFLLRGIWCIMKAFPFEPLACPGNEFQQNVQAFMSMHNYTKSKYGFVQYNLRETIRRVGVMTYFTSYSMIAFIFCRCCSITKLAGAAGATFQEEHTEAPELTPYTSLGDGEFVSERARKRSENEAPITGKTQKRKEYSITCVQMCFIMLNVWLYLVYIAFILVTWFMKDLDVPCNHTTPYLIKSTGEMTCGADVNDNKWCFQEVNPFNFHTPKCRTTWALIHDIEIGLVDILFLILMLSVAYFGTRLYLVVSHSKRKEASKALFAIRCKILSIVIVCVIGFLTRIVLTLWTTVGLPSWKSTACDILRPYCQYVLTELIPGLVLLGFMMPDCHTLRHTVIGKRKKKNKNRDEKVNQALELQTSPSGRQITTEDQQSLGGQRNSNDAEWLAGIEC